MLFFEYDEGLYGFTPVGIIDADDGHHLDGGMGVDDFFDLARPDFETTAWRLDRVME